MNQNYKLELYRDVIRIKRFMGFRDFQYRINLVKEFESFGIKTEAIPFKTRGLRGMAAVGEKPEPDAVSYTHLASGLHTAQLEVTLCILQSS